MTTVPLLFWDLLGAFLVGGSWIMLTTLIAERYGSRIGGLIGALPSTIAFGLLFIGITQSTATAVEASTITPLAYGITGVYLTLYVFLTKKNGFYTSLFLSLVIWFGFALGAVFLGVNNFVASAVAGIALLLASYYALNLELGSRSAGGALIKYGKRQIVARGTVGGLVVALAVFASKTAGPIFGGVFSMVPVVYSSTLFVTNRSRGKEFSRLITKPFVVNGSINIFSYVIAIRYFYPLYGLFLGTALAYFVVLAAAYGTYRLSSKR